MVKKSKQKRNPISKNEQLTMVGSPERWINIADSNEKLFQNFVEFTIKNKNENIQDIVFNAKLHLSQIIEELSQILPKMECYYPEYEKKFEKLSEEEKKEIKSIIKEHDKQIHEIIEQHFILYNYLIDLAESEETKKLIQNEYFDSFYSDINFYKNIIHYGLYNIVNRFDDFNKMPKEIVNKLPEDIPFLIWCFGYNIIFYKKFINMFQLEEKSIELLLDTSRYLEKPADAFKPKNKKKLEKKLKKLIDDTMYYKNLQDKIGHKEKANKDSDFIYFKYLPDTGYVYIGKKWQPLLKAFEELKNEKKLNNIDPFDSLNVVIENYYHLFNNRWTKETLKGTSIRLIKMIPHMIMRELKKN